jgi:hypothetical protein
VRLISHGGEIAEAPLSCVACFFGAHPRSEVLGNLLIQVELQLILELLPGAVATK